MLPISELFTHSSIEEVVNWAELTATQPCKYLSRRCLKVRKSQPEISIGTWSIHRPGMIAPLIVCPHRFLERGQVFFDCLHLLTLHEPGNELHRVNEIEIPGGLVDYFIVLVRDNRVVDFVGIELQSVDTTGSLWDSPQRFLASKGAAPMPAEAAQQAFGINWKMTAKTTLIQLHHKVETFESLGKHLVLVLQDRLMDYMSGQFQFDQVTQARMSDPLHFHTYTLNLTDTGYRLQMNARWSSTSAGIAAALGMKTSPNLTLQVVVSRLEAKLSSNTRIHL
jgi:hypothetical protein